MNREQRLSVRHELEDVEPIVDERVDQWLQEADLEESEIPEQRFEAKVDIMREIVPIVYERVQRQQQ